MVSQCACDDTTAPQEKELVPAKITWIGNYTQQDFISALTGNYSLEKKPKCTSSGCKNCNCCEAGSVVEHCCCDQNYPTCNKDSGIWLCAAGKESIAINVSMLFMLLSATVGRMYVW